jgi:hypothetical protein
MSTAGSHEQSVEVPEQFLRLTTFLKEAYSLCSVNPALNAIFVKTPKQLVQVLVQTQRMKEKV